MPLKEIATNGTIALSLHADDMCDERGISRDDVEKTVRSFDMLEEYPNAFPHPAVLLYGESDDRPIHVVAAFDKKAGFVYVVTVYFPDTERFEQNFRVRRRKLEQ